MQGMEAWFLQRNWRSYASPEWVLGRKIWHRPHERERTASIAWAAKIAILRALQVPTTAVSMSYSSRFEDEPLHKLRRWRSRSSRPVSIEGNNVLQPRSCSGGPLLANIWSATPVAGLKGDRTVGATRSSSHKTGHAAPPAPTAGLRRVAATPYELGLPRNG